MTDYIEYAVRAPDGNFLDDRGGQVPPYVIGTPKIHATHEAAQRILTDQLDALGEFGITVNPGYQIVSRQVTTIATAWRSDEDDNFPLIG